MSGRMAVCALVSALICGLAGCGGGDNEPSAANQDHGKQVFVGRPGDCDTFGT